MNSRPQVHALPACCIRRTGLPIPLITLTLPLYLVGPEPAADLGKLMRFQFIE